MRDRIADLRQLQSEQVIEAGQGNVDVIAAAVAGDLACVHVLYVRQGRILGSRSVYPRVPLEDEPMTVAGEFISQYYLRGGGSVDLPREIVAAVSGDEAEVLEQAIARAVERKVVVKPRVRGTRARWRELAERTAEQNLAGRLASRQNIQRRLEALGEALGLDGVPQRLECFDISHSSGEATVASCVVFGPEGPVKSDYRRFNIEGVPAGDDYGAMGQALERRFTRLKAGEGKMPDVLLIDGGKGQLRRASAVLNELGISGVQVVGVAKGVTRKPGMETLLLATEDRETELKVDSPVLHLIQQVRDEAHRFAITGHRQRRDKKRRESPLEAIPGVGPKRRRELLRFFGGSAEVAKASVNDIAKVPGISRKVAETIYSALRNE